MLLLQHTSRSCRATMAGQQPSCEDLQCEPIWRPAQILAGMTPV